ncbi:MAG: hypothetical protein ISS13_03325 [Actinobacteria bacterium]|nr:hypothetical protein [Actinomycetota bacterium]
MIFSNLNLKEIINSRYLKEYEEGIESFYLELAALNTNIFIINKIKEFRLDLFCPHDKSTFFLMVIKNFFEYSIITIIRLFEDTGFTIPKFKDRIINDYIKKEYKNAFIDRFNNIKFDDLTNDILKRVKHLRNKRFAHIIKNKKDIKNVNIEELEKIINYINLFFQNLSFNTGFDMLPIPYSKKVQHPKDSDSRPDIERILDSVAKESAFLNTPERYSKYPQVWIGIKKNWSEETLNVFYKYREKLGLPKI